MGGEPRIGQLRPPLQFGITGESGIINCRMDIHLQVKGSRVVLIGAVVGWMIGSEWC